MYSEAAAALDKTQLGQYCPACHLRKIACLCARRPVLQSRAKFFLLVHERELAKTTNTGHLVVNAFAGAEYGIWSRVEPPKRLLSLIDDGAYEPLVVFPADAVSASVTDVSTIPSHRSAKSPLLILLDATWQQASKMYRQSSYLAGLSLLSLQPQQASRYGLRRNQGDGHLSTVEVVIEILAQMQETAAAQGLNRYFQDFLHHYQASRSDHALVTGAGG